MQFMQNIVDRITSVQNIQKEINKNKRINNNFQLSKKFSMIWLYIWIRCRTPFHIFKWVRTFILFPHPVYDKHDY